eukprot:6188193-Pleurochrysis_carterae.AAC.4
MHLPAGTWAAWPGTFGALDLPGAIGAHDVQHKPDSVDGSNVLNQAACDSLFGCLLQPRAGREVRPLDAYRRLPRNLRGSSRPSESQCDEDLS